MQYNHEVIVPNEDLPFKMFLFEGKEGNYSDGVENVSGLFYRRAVYSVYT